MSQPADSSNLKNSLLSLLQPLLSDSSDRFCVALSGGLDSVVLLHLMVSLRDQGKLGGAELRAVHVNHGLQDDAEDWAEFVLQLCSDLNLDCRVHRLSIRENPKQRISEDQARQARYGVFSEELSSGECLLLAHHQDDQIETLLLRLLRGAGVSGLAGMPQSRPLGAGLLLRPLLYSTRESWCSMPTSTAFAGWRMTVIRTARLIATTCGARSCRALKPDGRLIGPASENRYSCWQSRRRLPRVRVEIDLQSCQLPELSGLSVAALRALSAGRRRTVLARWLQTTAKLEANWSLLQRIDAYLEQPRPTKVELYSNAESYLLAVTRQ